MMNGTARMPGDETSRKKSCQQWQKIITTAALWRRALYGILDKLCGEILIIMMSHLACEMQQDWPSLELARWQEGACAL